MPLRALGDDAFSPEVALIAGQTYTWEYSESCPWEPEPEGNSPTGDLRISFQVSDPVPLPTRMGELTFSSQHHTWPVSTSHGSCYDDIPAHVVTLKLAASPELTAFLALVSFSLEANNSAGESVFTEGSNQFWAGSRIGRSVGQDPAELTFYAATLCAETEEDSDALPAGEYEFTLHAHVFGDDRDLRTLPLSAILRCDPSLIDARPPAPQLTDAGLPTAAPRPQNASPNKPSPGHNPTTNEGDLNLEKVDDGPKLESEATDAGATHNYSEPRLKKDPVSTTGSGCSVQGSGAPAAPAEFALSLIAALAILQRRLAR